MQQKTLHTQVHANPVYVLTQTVDHMDLLHCVVVDGVGVVEPAVVGVPLLAVHHGICSVVGLWQLVPVLHFDQSEVTAVFLARVLLLAGAERPALDTLSEGRGHVNSEVHSGINTILWAF